MSIVTFCSSCEQDCNHPSLVTAAHDHLSQRERANISVVSYAFEHMRKPTAGLKSRLSGYEKGRLRDDLGRVTWIFAGATALRFAPGDSSMGTQLNL